MSALPPYLTDTEIADLCAPRRQGAAQIRYLKSIGVKVSRRPDGRPLVWRADVEPPKPPEVDEPDPPRMAFKHSALGRWQQNRTFVVHEPLSAEYLHSLEVRRAERHAAVIRHHAAKRRAAKLRRTPCWADEAAIRAIYARARELTVTTGIVHHVDHEVPLQGRDVSGLHVPANLKILTGSDNSRKGNRFEVG